MFAFVVFDLISQY